MPLLWILVKIGKIWK